LPITGSDDESNSEDNGEDLHEKVKKYSTLFVTGLLYYVNNQLYCEVLEFQFINAKVDNNPSAVIPCKIEKSNADKKTKDRIRNKISVIKASATPDSTTKKTKKPVPIRINEVAKTLLTSPIVQVKRKVKNQTKFKRTSLVRTKASDLKAIQ
jgi:hypothetical protein